MGACSKCGYQMPSALRNVTCPPGMEVRCRARIEASKITQEAPDFKPFLELGDLDELAPLVDFLETGNDGEAHPSLVGLVESGLVDITPKGWLVLDAYFRARYSRCHD